MKYFLSALLFGGLVTLLSGQPKDLNLSVAGIDAALLEGAESVVRYQHTEYAAEDDHTATLKYTKIVTLLSPESNDNTLRIGYADDIKLLRFKASLYDEYGEKIRDAKKSEIEDVMAVSNGQFYEDRRLKSLNLEHSEYPYTVVYEYEVKQRDFGFLIGFPHWSPVSFNQSCERATFTATYPADNELLYDAFGLEEPEIIASPDAMTFGWELREHSAIRYEPQSPRPARVLPNVNTQLRDFRVDNYVGSYADWQGFGSFIGQLMKGRSQLPETLRAEVQQVIADADTDLEKIDRLYRFLQDRVRYVGVQLGIGGFQPFSATYVEENRFGDCKALSNYMGALLGEAGIESYPVLVYSGRPFYAVHPDFTTSAFNHMILYVPAEDMYLECTSNYNPTGYLGESTHDRTVLHITPQGGQLARTPALQPAEHGHLRRLDVKVQPTGTAEISMNTRFFGAAQERLRSVYNYESPEDQKKWLHRVELLPNMSGVDYYFNVDKDLPEAELRYQTEVDRYARKMGRRLFIPLNKYFAYDDLPSPVSERKLPLVWDESRFYVDSIFLEIPPDFTIESMGRENISFSHPAGEYQSSIEVKGNRLSWYRTLKLVPVNLPASEYEDYRNFFVEVNKADRRQIVLKEKTTK